MPPATAAAPSGGAAPPAQPDATPIPPPPAEPAAPDAPATASAGLPETKSGEEKPADHAPPARAAAEAPDDDRKKAELGRPMPKGSAAPGAAVATGATLPPAVVQKVVQSHMRDVKRCRERASGGAAIEGKLLLAITVDDRGAVTNAVATTSTVPAELSQCVAALARAWTFPPPDGGGTVVVNYPFTFSTKE